MAAPLKGFIMVPIYKWLLTTVSYEPLIKWSDPPGMWTSYAPFKGPLDHLGQFLNHILAADQQKRWVSAFNLHFLGVNTL